MLGGIDPSGWHTIRRMVAEAVEHSPWTKFDAGIVHRLQVAAWVNRDVKDIARNGYYWRPAARTLITERLEAEASAFAAKMVFFEGDENGVFV